MALLRCLFSEAPGNRWKTPGLQDVFILRFTHQILTKWSSSGFPHWELRELPRHKESQNLRRDRQENRKFWCEIRPNRIQITAGWACRVWASSWDSRASGAPSPRPTLLRGTRSLKTNYHWQMKTRSRSIWGRRKENPTMTKQWKDVALTVSVWMAWSQQGREKPNQSCGEVWIFIFEAMREP